MLEALDDEIAAQSALVSRHDLVLGQLGSALEVAESRLVAVRGEVRRHGAAREAAVARRDAGRAELAEREQELAAVSASSEGVDDPAEHGADGSDGADGADRSGGDQADH